MRFFVTKKQGLLVRYKMKHGKMESENFWLSIKNQTDINSDLALKIDMHRSVVMNPFSHYDLEKPEFKKELEDTIDAVKEIKSAAGRLKRVTSFEGLKNDIKSLHEKLSGRDKNIEKLKKRLTSIE